MLHDGLLSMIHDDGDPEPPSDPSCKKTEETFSKRMHNTSLYYAQIDFS